MIIREPLIQATYYYLHEAPGESASRREDRYRLFVEDTQRMFASVAGWLAMSAPDLPALAPVERPTQALHPLMAPAELRGHTNAAAWLQAYALRNMLLLRVVLARPGDHEHTVWQTLDESLGGAPTTPTWLATARYWCGIAARLPEELDAQFPQSMRLEFGLFSPGEADARLLIYPDTRSEARARHFLSVTAPRLDWYPVEADVHLARYADHVAQAGRAPQAALDRVAQTMQGWTAPDARSRLRSLDPLGEEITALEAAYHQGLRDLDITRATAGRLNRLAGEYRLALMQSGLWDAAPAIWEARVAQVSAQVEQVEAEVVTVEVPLRRIELMMQTVQTRVLLLQSERERRLATLLAAVGVALVALLIADTDPVLMLVRVLLLALVAGGVALAWRRWQGGQGEQGE